ncbi:MULTISPECIES: SOS response-associated peptidase [Arthrobacter]|uniref:Abasic site processing protein n=2 Tax=Arthrobacter TaxID=1663 RepID=A0ABU9KQM4_9MICC|nr:SOS response-associated peptidase [Arthrobacter sp. YJM1]MDP5228674.1 SOS response-associated peptidase [Arthrobacter sp. YJM1]
MCGRYVMAQSIEDLADELDAEDIPEDRELAPSWNIPPTSDVPILLERFVDGTLRRQLHIAYWGLVPRWAKEQSIGVRSFNARSETAAEKPTFRQALKSRRCAVPAEGYFEWLKGTGPAKQPFYVHPSQEGKLITFAGLYEWWRDVSKEPDAPDAWLLSTTILTMAAPEPDHSVPVLAELGRLHDRLPIPLGKDSLAAWLDPSAEDGAGLLEMIRSRGYEEAASWTLDRADPAVGNVRNNSPALLKETDILF